MEGDDHKEVEAEAMLSMVLYIHTHVNIMIIVIVLVVFVIITSVFLLVCHISHSPLLVGSVATLFFHHQSRHP